jgi:ABC-type transporter Mla maintaining outer membrane lipid asymmetry permease subunit MlaE
MIVPLTIVAVSAIIAGCVLAITGYSSAGPFSIASACVGVMGTLIIQEVNHHAVQSPPAEGDDHAS